MLVEHERWWRVTCVLCSNLADNSLGHVHQSSQRYFGSHLLTAMDDAYGLLVSFDYPDAVTGGLRRQVDALRAVLERTRGDLTTAVLQSRLQAALGLKLPANPATPVD